jgi:hypothetical protein
MRFFERRRAAYQAFVENGRGRLRNFRCLAFLPPALPPNQRALDLASLQAILAETNQAIGRLDGTTSSRKGAVLSSQIEGTQSSLSDFLLYENAEVPGVPLDDVQLRAS